MSTNKRSTILRTRKNSEADHDNRSRKRKRINQSSSEAACQNNNNSESICLSEDGSGGHRRIMTRQATKENDGTLTLSQEPSTPGDSTSFSFPNYFKEPLKTSTPLPVLNWADSEELWSVLKEKDSEYVKNGWYMSQHPALQPKMRTILLDWLIEVCEVYRLHRETFHLAVGYVDRYLLTKHNVQKSRLQLVGVTALFIAAKLEEIYPPKLTEFSYVTDGACTDDEILSEELVMLKTLDWKLTPITVNTWLRIYLQLARFKQEKETSEFLVPVFSGKEFVQVAKLLDLCVLDLESLQFPNSILAASALYHTLPIDITKVAGISWQELFPCIQWMRPFSAAAREQGSINIRLFDKIPPEDCPNIQTHANELALLNKAVARKTDYPPVSRHSPPSPALGVLTPPSSTKKGKPPC